MAKISARKSRPIRKLFVSLPPTNELIYLKPNKIMKKQYAQMLLIAAMLLMLVGSTMRCQQRKAETPSAEAIETEQAAAPEKKATAEITSEEPMDSAQKAYFNRQYFEALTKMADGGKVYATDADGKRSPKAFTQYDDYEQFIADNPQYPRNHYSYDADGKPFDIQFTNTSVQGNVTDIEEKIEAVPTN